MNDIFVIILVAIIGIITFQVGHEGYHILELKRSNVTIDNICFLGYVPNDAGGFMNFNTGWVIGTGTKPDTSNSELYANIVGIISSLLVSLGISIMFFRRSLKEMNEIFDRIEQEIIGLEIKKEIEIIKEIEEKIPEENQAEKKNPWL
jgi:hypothetical protein